MFIEEFEIEFITPAFIRGADQRIPEVRSPSIKGAMRWWFRALAGSYFGDDAQKLKEIENQVFGSTKERSRVKISVTPLSSPKRLNLKEFKDKNVGYIWFSMNLLGKRGTITHYYPPGSRFRVVLESPSERVIKLATLSLWALVSLGSVGFRSRRGTGSMKIVRASSEVLEDLGLTTEFNSIDEFKDSLKRVLDVTGEILGVKNSETNKSLPSYATLKFSDVEVFGPGKNTWEVLAQFNNSYKEYLRRRIKKYQRIIFGLPRFKLRGVRKDLRRASPLWFGVVEIGGKPYGRIIKFFQSTFHPEVRSKHIVDWNVLSNFDWFISSRLPVTKVWGGWSG